MKNKQLFWVPWSKETGYLGAYCGYSKKDVIQDLEHHYTDNQWATLRKSGMKLKRVEFKEIKNLST